MLADLDAICWALKDSKSTVFLRPICPRMLPFQSSDLSGVKIQSDVLLFILYSTGTVQDLVIHSVSHFALENYNQHLCTGMEKDSKHLPRSVCKKATTVK